MADNAWFLFLFYRYFSQGNYSVINSEVFPVEYVVFSFQILVSVFQFSIECEFEVRVNSQKVDMFRCVNRSQSEYSSWLRHTNGELIWSFRNISWMLQTLNLDNISFQLPKIKHSFFLHLDKKDLGKFLLCNILVTALHSKARGTVKGNEKSRSTLFSCYVFCDGTIFVMVMHTVSVHTEFNPFISFCKK